MKTIVMNTAKLMILGLVFFSMRLIGQEVNAVENIITEPFDAIEATGAIRLYLSQGPEQKIRIETAESLEGKTVAEVKGHTLVFPMKGVEKPTKMKIYVSYINLSHLEASGACIVKGETTLTTERLRMDVGGASKLEMDIKVSELISEFSGAAEVKLSGTADLHRTELSGAANLKAADLLSKKGSAELSGASNARLNVTEEFTGETSGVSKVSLVNEPAKKNIERTGVSKVIIGDVSDTGITIPQILIDGNKMISVGEHGIMIEGDSGVMEPLLINEDGVKMIIKEKDKDGKKAAKVLIINDDGVKVIEKDLGEVKEGKAHRSKFNGHWRGLDLGVNGFVNADNTLDLPKGWEDLDLRMGKSINVKINFLEQNFNLIRNKLGLTTGLGLEYVNYRFDNNVVLSADSGKLQVFRMESGPKLSYEKSKLVVNYLNLPLMLEFQTNPHDKINSFHIAAGVNFGMRIGSHTKVVTEDDGKRVKDKERDDFYINPFKYEAMARIGWGKLDLYGNYSLNTLFKDDKGPELYPFAIGLAFDVN